MFLPSHVAFCPSLTSHHPACADAEQGIRADTSFPVEHQRLSGHPAGDKVQNKLKQPVISQIFPNQFSKGKLQTQPLALGQGEAEQMIVLSAGIHRYPLTVWAEWELAVGDEQLPLRRCPGFTKLISFDNKYRKMCVRTKL